MIVDRRLQADACGSMLALLSPVSHFPPFSLRAQDRPDSSALAGEKRCAGLEDAALNSRDAMLKPVSATGA
jgi:hypothetical protein